MPFPKYKPMLAFPDNEHLAIGNPNYIIQRKWDGERILAYKEKSKVTLINRRNVIKNKNFPNIVTSLSALPHDFVIDGEVVALPNGIEGKDDFSMVQSVSLSTTPEAITSARQYLKHIYYSIFDIMWIDGRDLTTLPLLKRLEILNSLNFKLPCFITPLLPNTPEFFGKICRAGWEGVMAKQKIAPYMQTRSKFWLKERCWKEATSIAVALLPGQGKREAFFGGIALARKVNGQWKFVGSVGSGFNDSEIHRLYSLLSQYRTNPYPVEGLNPSSVKFYIKPVFEVDVKFLEITKDGRFRFPVFVRLKEVV